MRARKARVSLPCTQARPEHMLGSRGGGGGGAGGPDPLKITKNIGFLSNTGPDPLKNHKATKPEFNVGSPSARPMIARLKWYMHGSFTSSTKKSQSWIPSDKAVWIRAWNMHSYIYDKWNDNDFEIIFTFY